MVNEKLRKIEDEKQKELENEKQLIKSMSFGERILTERQSKIMESYNSTLNY